MCVLSGTLVLLGASSVSRSLPFACLSECFLGCAPQQVHFWVWTSTCEGVGIDFRMQAWLHQGEQDGLLDVAAIAPFLHFSLLSSLLPFVQLALVDSAQAAVVITDETWKPTSASGEGLPTSISNVDSTSEPHKLLAF